MESTFERINRRRDRIEVGAKGVRNLINDNHDRHEEAVKLANFKGEEPPEPNLPNVGDVAWVTEAAEILKLHGVPVWVRDVDLVAGFEDLVGQVIERLREFPEFSTWEGLGIEVRWSRKAITVKDVTAELAHPGRPKVIPEADRLSWPSDEEAPMFRLELSLPWFLLATEGEIEAGLHHLLSSFATDDDGKAVLRRPEITAFASTLARYGLANPREAQAVAHATAHPSTRARMRQWGYDAETGQGLLWGAGKERREATERARALRLVEQHGDDDDEPAVVISSKPNESPAERTKRIRKELEGVTSSNPNPRRPKSTKLNPPPAMAGVTDLPDTDTDEN